MKLDPTPESSAAAWEQDGEQAQNPARLMGESLRAATAYQQAVLNAIPDGVVVMDLDGEIRQANAAAEQLFGLPAGGLFGRDLWSYLADGQNRGALASEVQELQFITERGRAFFAWVSIRPVVVSGTALQVVVVRDIDAQVDQARELASKQREREAFGALLLESQEEERRRIALDLHDDIGQRIAGLGIGIHQALEDRAGQEQEMAGVIIGQIEETAAAIRGLSLDLRPAVLDHAGLVEALEALSERLRAHAGFEAAVIFENLAPGERLGGEVEIGAYRIVQEALTNALKHAQVGGAHVLLARRGGVLIASIRDSGAGFDPDGPRVGRTVGLSGMAERAAQLGGQLHVLSAPGEGTTILAELPLPGRKDCGKCEKEGFAYEEDFNRR